MSNLASYLRGQKKQWYEAHKNTAQLVDAVLRSRSLDSLSGDDIWNLLQLTWITRAKSGDYWKKLKVPALADFFGQQGNIRSGLNVTIAGMRLPQDVETAAAKETGFVNFRNVWRKSSRKWCEKNRDSILRIIEDATRLTANDRARLILAEKIDDLSPVPAPSSAGPSCGPAVILTPLVSCLDPGRRFPVINGRAAVRTLLNKLGLANRTLKEQVTGMLGLIGQNGISDSFMIDVLAEEIVPIAKKLPKGAGRSATVGKGAPLPDFDEDERKAVLKSETITYRKRHNKMTNALKQLCKGRKITQGSQPHCRYDVLIEDYDRTGRDLLLEVKPDPDRGAIRIAIGQLLDYRRFVPHRAGTDLGVLTILPPEKTYCDLLLDQQISPVWFATEDCQALQGEGHVWEAWRTALGI